jgi:hypothetical protein
MRRSVGLAALAVLVLLALIPIGRWEAGRHARDELAGIHRVLQAIGPIDQRSLDAYRVGVGTDYALDCLLYKRGANPFALELCFERTSGRVVEAYDRRGDAPRIWSLREDPGSSDVQFDLARLKALVARLQQPA